MMRNEEKQEDAGRCQMIFRYRAIMVIIAYLKGDRELERIVLQPRSLLGFGPSTPSSPTMVSLS